MGTLASLWKNACASSKRPFREVINVPWLSRRTLRLVLSVPCWLMVSSLPTSLPELYELVVSRLLAALSQFLSGINFGIASPRMTYHTSNGTAGGTFKAIETWFSLAACIHGCVASHQPRQNPHRCSASKMLICPKPWFVMLGGQANGSSGQTTIAARNLHSTQRVWQPRSARAANHPAEQRQTGPAP